MRSKKRTKILLTVGTPILGAALAAGGFLILYHKPQLSVDETNLPRFVSHDVLERTQIGAVSRFRSGAGESYTSGGETCRNMSHLITPPSGSGFFDQNAVPPSDLNPEDGVAVFSPVDGVIKQVEGAANKLGSDILIQSNQRREYSFTIFHVYPLRGMAKNTTVSAGQRIGTKLKAQTIAVDAGVRTLWNGRQLIPYTSVLSDDLFSENYASRGGGDRTNFTIARETRDADPLTCNGNVFIYENFGNVESGLRLRHTKDFVQLGNVL